MLKQGIFYLVLSIIVVLFAQYATLLLAYIDLFYTFVNTKLALIFSGSEWGILSRKVLSLVLIPVVIASIPALIYRAIKGQQMPYVIEIAWLLWLVIVLSKILMH